MYIGTIRSHQGVTNIKTTDFSWGVFSLAATEFSPQLFLTVSSSAYSFDQSSLAFSGRPGANKWNSFSSQHWQIKLFSCCFVFPYTLAYSFDLKFTCFIWLLFFFFLFSVESWTQGLMYFSWAKLPALVLNFSINFFQKRKNKINQHVRNFYAILTHLVTP